MTDHPPDPIRAFYESHPYPPPLDELDEASGEQRRRADHHLMWPRVAFRGDRSILVAGCGTSQAARYASRFPDATVVGIDVSEASLDSTRRLADRYELRNLEVRDLPIEEAGDLGRSFDQIVCTGVIHHLADPAAGLAALRSVTAPGGALMLMVYARYGRIGVSLLQDYCRRLGVTPTGSELEDLVATMREIPMGHPIRPVLANSADFHDDQAIVDALLNPRERNYTVPELFDLLNDAGFRFGRWVRQAEYHADCGAIAETPHAARILELPPDEQYAAVELFRGTIARHSLVAHRDDGASDSRLDFSDPEALGFVPVPLPTVIALDERLPDDAAAALLNRAHSSTDLVMFVDRAERALFDRIDGHRTIGDLGPDAAAFVERLWRHDLVVVDASGGELR